LIFLNSFSDRADGQHLQRSEPLFVPDVCQVLSFVLPYCPNVKKWAGNSALLLQERYEVPILNFYQNETPFYSKGRTGSILHTGHML
jgi:hypothetical protein